MNSITYLKERIGFFLINSILFSIVCSIVLMLDGGPILCVMIFVIWFVPLLTYMMMEFIKYRNYYAELQEVLEGLSPKYLLPEVMSKPTFSEAKIIYDLLKVTHKEMHEQVNVYKDMQEEYKEYVESWIHEIKTPIAAAKLMIENNEGPVTYKIASEIKQVESFVEQALYYARSNDVSKDYIIKPLELRSVIVTVIKENSRTLIQKKITPQLEALDDVVYSDSKWVIFIVNQIIGNSMKYSKESGGMIKVYSEKQRNKVILNIQDNGIGINEKDVKYVFDKGFTGENGRKFSRSTGIGLYLCKRLCDKLGLGITLESTLGEGTRVQLIFPLGEITEVR